MFTLCAIPNMMPAAIAKIVEPGCVAGKPETGHGRQADTAGTEGCEK